MNAYYGLPMAKCKYEDLGGGAYFIHYRWDSNDRDELVETEDKSMAMDQLMRFDFDGKTGWGIFEILMGGRRIPAVSELASDGHVVVQAGPQSRSIVCPRTGKSRR